MAMRLYRPRDALVTAVLAAVLAVPATADAAARPAAVHGSCQISGCAAARQAHDGWAGLGFPTSRGWYPWSNGQDNFAGGRYRNDNRQLPTGDRFQEFDVYPRAKGAPRD